MKRIHKHEIDTPALVLDLDLMEKNLATMASFFSKQDTDLRPHVKTHKCPIIAHKQVDAGAIGITCAKLGEAEVMAQAGIQNILIANQVIGENKIARLVSLARIAEVVVAVDDLGNVRQLSDAGVSAGIKLNVIIEIDVGMKRCGISVGPQLISMAKAIRQSPGLCFKGLMGYEGHAVFQPEESERKRVAAAANKTLVSARDMLIAESIPVEIVSAGGTGTYKYAGTCPGITDVQAGSYIVSDVRYHSLLPEFEQALTVLCTVISRTRPNAVITDAGLKAFSTGWGLPAVKGRDDIEMLRLSEEHGIAKTVGPTCDIRLGDKLEMYVSHCCTAINLHDRYYAVRGDYLEAEWPILARGKGQ